MTRALVVTLFSTVVLGCGDSPVVVTPTPLEPLPPYPATSVRIWGTVVEHRATGRTPLAGLSFDARQSLDEDGADSAIVVTSDADGKFQFDARKDAPLVFALPDDSAYHAPCPPGFGRITDHQTLELHVVSAALLATDGSPSSLPSTEMWVSGVVYQVDSKDQAWWDFVPTLSGATVKLSTTEDALVASTTLTDSEGRFLLCTNPPGAPERDLWLSARKTDYLSETVMVTPPVAGSGHDLFLVRR